MHGPVITVDVSKGINHYQGFENYEKAYTKSKKIKNTKSDFEEFMEYVEKLKVKTNVEDIPIVFEATGVYHRCFQAFLDDSKIPYIIISPLISARFRKLELHSNKTDPLDCKNIAKVFYLQENLYRFNKMDEYYINLQKLNRYYEDQLNHLRKQKVGFKSYLDVVFPYFDKCFDKGKIYNDLPLEILMKYPHPELVLQASEDKMVEYLLKKCNHQIGYVRNVVKKVRKLAEDVYSGCDKNGIEVQLLKQTIINLRYQIKICDEAIETIIQEANKSPNFEAVKSIVGIGDNLAARIIAELGDVTRFKKKNQLISYAGLDPMIRQSGNINGEHLSISKKGNKYLRCLLYQAISANYRLKKNDRLYEFNQKKRQQTVPLKPKAANTATAHKLLVIIYGMCKTGSLYES
ncbi:MAG: IS110 family transposase [Bacillota bacterium]|nr:IS110 family transposase [Bacillota bacterium]